MTDATPKPRPAQARWDAMHPKERWAHQSLRSALKRGLIKQEPCEVCGSEDSEGHHDNYDMPMVVRWLCRLHHRHVHKRPKDSKPNGEAA